MAGLSALGISRTSAGATLIALAAMLAWSMGRQPVAAQTAGVIRGVVRVGAPSPAETLPVTVDRPVCGPTVPDERLVTSPSGDVTNAVIVLEGLKAAGTLSPVDVVNQKCRFAPHVVVTRPGGIVKVGSSDNTVHTTHAYAQDNSTLFNVAIPIAGLTVSRTLAKAGVIQLKCDTHPWMRGFIVVTDDRTALSGADGRFEMAAVPAGTYTLRVWHEQLKPSTQRVTVPAGGTTAVTITLQ